MGPGPEVEPGTSIAVFWDLDRKWYTAEVLHYDPVTGIYKLLYTDGEREEVDLTAVKYKPLWGGQLRDRMGKAGGDISKKQSIDHMVKTLLDVEDRLPPIGVFNNKKRWWSAWHSRVTNAGNSGNVAELVKASVEIAFQMKDNISTSWWKSQRLNWQKEVESSTTIGALSSRLTDFLTKAVDWKVARQLFPSEVSESDQKRSTVEGGRERKHLVEEAGGRERKRIVEHEGGRERKRIVEGEGSRDRKRIVEDEAGQDPVSMDRSVVDEKATTGSAPSAREQRMMERERRENKNSRNLDEDNEMKKSASNSAEFGRRRSKRKRIVEEDDGISHVDSHPSDTSVVNPMIAEKGPSAVKRRKGGKADAGRHSDSTQHNKLEKAQSEADTLEPQSSVVETKIRKLGRKGRSIETREGGQGSGTDPKAQDRISRVRRSKRGLEPDRSEAGQTSETTASGRNVASTSSAPIPEVGNSNDLQERKASTKLKDTTKSIRGSSRITRSSILKSEVGHAESSKVSRGEESAPTKGCGTVKEGTQELEQVSEFHIETKRGRPNRTKTYQLEKADDGDGKEKIGNSTESPGISIAKNARRSAHDSNVVPREATVTRVKTRLQRAPHTEDQIESSGDAIGRVERVSEKSQKHDAADESINVAEDHVVLPAQDSNVAQRDAIVTRVETRLQKAAQAEEQIGRSGNASGRVERTHEKPKKHDAANFIDRVEDDVVLSAQESDVGQRDSIATGVETGLQQAGHIAVQIIDLSGDDAVGRDDNIIKKPQKHDEVRDESINPADDHVGVSARDSNVVPQEEMVTRVEPELQQAGHTENDIKSSGGPVDQVEGIIIPRIEDAAEESIRPADDQVGVSTQDSNVVPQEAIVTRVEPRLQKGYTQDEIGRTGDPVGRAKRIIKKPQRYSDADESLKPAEDHVGMSAQESNVVPQQDSFTQVGTRLQNEIGRSGDTAGHARRSSKKPLLFDAAEGSRKPQKLQDEGRQGRIGPRGEAKQINVSTGADDVRARNEDGNNPPDKEKLSPGRKAMESGEGEDGAEKGPSTSNSSGDVRQTRRGRLVRKASESKVNENQDVDPILLVEAETLKQVKEEHSALDGSVKLENKADGDEEVQEWQRAKPADIAAGSKTLEQQTEISEELDSVNEVSRKRDPLGNGVRLEQETEMKQKRHSIARLEKLRLRSGGARLDVLDEHETEESSGEEPHRGTRSRSVRSGKRKSRKSRRSQSFNINYEEFSSGSSSQEDSEEYKVEDDDDDDEEEPEVVALEDSWGERLPTDDSDMEDDAPPLSELKESPLGQEELSLEQPVTIQDMTVGDEKCSVCDFAGADELMLLCDQSGCTCALHTFCLTPPLKAIPEGEWFCPKCTQVKANRSDTGRLPKSCSSVKYPVKVLGSIIGRRRELSQEGKSSKIQYLVKWDSLSHEHDSWIPEDWLLFMHNRLVTNFQRKYSDLSETNINVDERRPEWLQVDRIIACRKHGSKVPVKPPQVSALLRSRQEGKTGVEFLVKWQTLEHKSATWEQERETDEFQQAIASYKNRHERVDESEPKEENAKAVTAIKMQPDYVSGGMMYAFQLHGLKWLLSNFEQRRSVILADEMGLGKTIQALAFISCVRYEKLSSRPALVIAPKSTLPGWEQEFRRWAPSLNVVVYQGDKENRAFIREHEFHSANKTPLFEVLLTSYELAAFDNTLLSRFHWASLVVDEGHRVKNVRCKLGTLLKRHTADFRLLLTGTPVQNTLTELFALLHFLDPKEFPDPEAEAREFTEVDAQSRNGQSDSKVIEQQVAKLHELLNPRMLRRLKTEVLRDMIPGKKVVEVSCALTTLQRHLYSAILKRNFKVLNKGVKSGMKRSLHMILTDLKMVCDHPYLFPGKEPQHLEPSKAFKMLVAASGKFQLLEKLLPLLKEKGHRVLLFSQMTKMLDILEDFMAFLGLSYARIDGSCSASSRQKSIVEFNAANSSTFIFLISTRAGGLGINLPSADTVIIYDPDFNPFVDLQAQARAHRIGQDKTVLVYQLITKCSVEEKILQRARKKLAMENLVMSRESKETAADINTLLLHGAQKVLDEHDIEATSIKVTEESVRKLLDREFLSSTTNDDEPTAHGYLGAVQGADFSSPTVNEQEDQEAKGGDGNEWHELLHHLVEQDEKEELGRGKRVRKQVVYALEGHAEGQEEEEYNPSSNDDDSSSDSDLSLDLEGMKWKAASAIKKPDHVVGDVPTMQYPGMPGMSPMSSMVHKGGAAGLFVPGGANVPVSYLPLNLPPHASMLSARGNSVSLMGSSGNIVLPRPSQETGSFGVVASKPPTFAARSRGSMEGLGSTSTASLPCTSRGSHLGPMPTNRTMLGDQSSHLPNTHFATSPVQFPGVYPYTNNVNPYAVPSYATVPVSAYTHYNLQPLPSHPSSSQFRVTDARVEPQNQTTGNPAWAALFNLQQQATHGWKISNVQQMSAPAVSGIPWSGRGGHMPGRHHGSIGHQLPTASSPNFQSTPSSVQSGSGPAHQPLPSSVENKKVSDSSHLSSAAGAPWLAGYCTVSNSLSRQVGPKVISPPLATPPLPVPSVPVRPAVPYAPTLYPAFEFHDPTALQVPPTPMNMPPPIRVPEPLGGRASGVVHSVPPAGSSKVNLDPGQGRRELANQECSDPSRAQNASH
ncbi:unnamed protein product [Calypogeia fissa]